MPRTGRRKAKEGPSFFRLSRCPASTMPRWWPMPRLRGARMRRRMSTATIPIRFSPTSQYPAIPHRSRRFRPKALRFVQICTQAYAAAQKPAKLSRLCIFAPLPYFMCENCLVIPGMMLISVLCCSRVAFLPPPPAIPPWAYHPKGLSYDYR